MILPNVSYIVDKGIVAYNPNVVINNNNSLTLTLNITENVVGEQIMLYFNLPRNEKVNLLSNEIIVNGKPQELLTAEQNEMQYYYTIFDNVGIYDVELIFNELITCAVLCYCCGMALTDEPISTATKIDVTNLKTDNVLEFAMMFGGIVPQESLSSIIGLNELNLSNATNFDWLFAFCVSLKIIDLTLLNLDKITNMGGMFGGCASLTEVRMGGNPCSLTDASDMFDGIETNGKFYYNSAYDYSLILSQLPSTWEAVPCKMVDGVLIPN